MLRKMRVVPLSKSAEYVQAHTADGDENGCPTLLPPLILTDTGLKDKKQLFSFEGLRESCGLIPIMKPFGRKSSAAAEEDEGIMAVDEVCSCVTLDEYLSYTQDVKALYESCTPVPSSPQPLSSSQQQQLPSTLSASGDQNMGGSDNSAKDEKKVEPTEGTDTTTTTSTIISPGDLSNRLLYARNVICLSSWKAAINECFSGTPFAFNSPHNLFNTLP